MFLLFAQRSLMAFTLTRANNESNYLRVGIRENRDGF